MRDTKVIQTIIQTLEAQSIAWRKMDNKQKFLTLFPNIEKKKKIKDGKYLLLIGEEAYDNTALRTNWSNWLNKSHDKNIRNKFIKSELPAIFGLPYDIWSKGDILQKELIDEAVQHYLSPSFTIDFSQLYISDSNITPMQQNYLNDMLKEEKALSSCPYLEKKEENQAFLIELIKRYYQEALYDETLHLYNFLQEHNRSKRELQKIYAHTLGSIKENPDYTKAYKILLTLKENNLQDTDIIDIQTSLISNLRRDIFSQTFHPEQTSQKISELKNYYRYIFEDANNHTDQYYPAINYAYMLFLEHKDDYIETIQTLLQTSKISLQHAKNTTDTNRRYYGTISEIEFALLLGKDTTQELSMMLEQLSPHKDPILRTKRQMLQTLHIAKHLEIKQSKLHTFYKAIDTLQDYIEYV
jgi:hypothetical protein